MELLDRLRGISEPVVCVHDGRFHADELLALAALREALQRPIHVNRSRDPNAWRRADLVIDVGGAANPFDHHHAGAPRHSNGIPYASCGLLLDAVEPDEKLRRQLYIDLFYAVEWDDNTTPGEVTSPNWELKSNLLSWVPSFQPLREEAPSEYEMRAYFDKALDMVTEIYRRVRTSAIIKIKNRDLEDKTTFIVRDGFLIVPSAGTPYQRYMFEHPEVYGAVVPETNGSFTIKLWRDGPKDPVYRDYFPSSWCGRSDFELQQLTGINGLVYCNNSGNMLKCKSMKSVDQVLRELKKYR